ncbi:Sensor histidine kinase YycG [compost metagenome]
MDISRWTMKWVVALLISVLLLFSSSTYMLIERSNHDNRDIYSSVTTKVMNQARLLVSDMMTYMEQYSTSIEEHSEELRLMGKEYNLNLLLVDLDGNVIFNSDSDDPVSHIDIKTTVGYDRSPSHKESSDVIDFAFPVTDLTTGRQTANAIFTVPEDQLRIPEDVTKTYILAFATILSLLVLCTLVIFLTRKMKQEVVSPLYQLQRHSESILKGNYEQRVEYIGGGEMGELYSMFDQMRMEIMDLHQRRDAAEKAHKELISNISHDLKTPLATMIAYIEAIQDGVCPDMDTLMEYIQVMHAQSHKMTGLIDDLFVHAIQELGQITVNMSEQYSRSLFTEILTPIGHFVATRGVIYEGPENIPDVLIKADAVRIEQVISNLVTNALKHTSAGDRISIHIEQLGESGRELRITVVDTGEGIHPKDMPFVFERYYQGQTKPSSNSNSQRAKGSGLGLSICKTIVEAHGGVISFHSTKDQGTTFYFTIPVG